MRDALLGLPVVDLDFSVEGDAVALADELIASLGGKGIRHSRFGTATVEFPQNDTSEGPVRVDLVSARRESYPTPGQLPVVEPGAISDDLARRDFSFNAMALPVYGRDVELHDPHGGIEDLAAGLVRVLHAGSFFDDPTRMMRAIRYEQRLGFRIAPDTLELIAEALAEGCMNTVSGDRWRHELEKIFEETNPVAPLRRASVLQLLAGLHPAFDRLAEGDYEGFRKLDNLRRESGHVTGDMCLAALFSGLDTVEGKSVIARLRLTGQQASIARDTIVLRNSELEVRDLANHPSKLVRYLSGLSAEAVESWAGLTGDATVAFALRRYVREWRKVKPAITGDDLLELGAVEGPMVGEVLNILRDARLDGMVSSEEAELEMARELLARQQSVDSE